MLTGGWYESAAEQVIGDKALRQPGDASARQRHGSQGGSQMGLKYRALTRPP